MLNQKAPLAKFDGAQPDQIAAQISRCDKALSKATAPTL